MESMQLQSNYEVQIGASFTDGLTGLYNHGFFQIYMEREIKRYLRQGRPFSIALIDVDWFSLYNRRNGYQNGDKVLKQVADIVRSMIRDVDLACRFASDQFAILVSDTDVDEAYTVAERIHSSVERVFDGEITVSIGLAGFPQNAEDREGLIQKAVEALNSAKIRGKNQIFLFDNARVNESDETPKVLIVDDMELNLKLIQAMLEPMQYEILKAQNGEKALHIVHHENVDIVLLDIMMPGMDGFEVCRRIKGGKSTRIIPVILVTALDDMDSKIRGIKAGADDFISKPPNKMELQTRTKSLIKIKRLNSDLTDIENVLFSLAKAIEAKNPYTKGHVTRVASLAAAIARSMRLSEQELQSLSLGGVLHDIGKIGIANSILNKPGPLDDNEWQIIKAHPDIGYQICLPLKNRLKHAMHIIRHHHEKLDGTGYPDGLKGDEISNVARIMAVADIYDALISDRPYRQRMSKQKAFSILKDEADKGKLDADVVEHLIAIIDNGHNVDIDINPAQALPVLETR